MRLADVSRLASALEGVTERTRAGLLDWRFRGRLVARELDERRIAKKAGFLPRMSSSGCASANPLSTSSCAPRTRVVRRKVGSAGLEMGES